MKKLATLLLAAAFVIVPVSARAVRQEAPPASPEPSTEKSGEGEGEGMEGWKWANFALLAAGLGYLIAKNGGPFFAARSKKIRQEMTEAEMALKESQERAAAVDRRLASLESEVAEMRNQSKAEAEAEAARIAQHTAAEMAKIRAQAESEIESAGKAARSELKRYEAHLAVALAEQKVRARINRDTEAALVQGFVHDLGAPASRSQAH